MKKIILSIMLAVFATGIANAQRAGEYNLSNNNGEITSYNRIGLSYRNVRFSGGGDGIGYNGAGFDYIHGFSLSSSIPVFLELGGNVSFTTRNNGGDYGGYMTIEMPVNCAYRISLADNEFGLSPFFGFVFKGNIIGTSDLDYDTQYWYDSNDFRRFQFGWNIGLNFDYKKLYLGFGYGTDFVKIAERLNTGTFSLKLGLNI